MSFHELKQEIEAALAISTLIVQDGNFSAHKRIEASLIRAKVLLENENLQDSKKEIALSFRLISEAPPKNKEYGMRLFLALDSLYKKMDVSKLLGQ